MNRRALLKALPAAVVAGAAPAAALCVVDPAETPVMRAYREWRALADSEAAANGDTATDIRMDELEDFIINTPAQNAEDWIAKAMSWSVNGKYPLPSLGSGHSFWAEARALIG